HPFSALSAERIWCCWSLWVERSPRSSRPADRYGKDRRGGPPPDQSTGTRPPTASSGRNGWRRALWPGRLSARRAELRVTVRTSSWRHLDPEVEHVTGQRAEWMLGRVQQPIIDLKFINPMCDGGAGGDGKADLDGGVIDPARVRGCVSDAQWN